MSETQRINRVKLILPVVILLVFIALDQWIKVYVKTHFQYSEVRDVFGNWFKLYFIENEGMAFGLKWGGIAGKYLLTGFRIAVSGFGAWYLWQNIKKGAPLSLLISISLIMAGALGNIIDSVFYGVWFSKINLYSGGYFQGHVVDMFYAPMVHGEFPSWFPFWKNEPFTFFSPIWNLADACITVGIGIIIVGQHKFFPPHTAEKKGAEVEAQHIEEAAPSHAENQENPPDMDTENLGQ